MNYSIIDCNRVDSNLITITVLLILGCVTSFLFYFFEGLILFASEAEIVFFNIQKYIFFFYITISVVLLVGLKDQHVKILIIIKIIIATVVLGSFSYFLIYFVYPLYLTRYSYCIAESTILYLFFLPDGSFYLDFPLCGIVLGGIQYQITMTVTCMQPAFWVYFIGPIAFYPGKMNLREKLKKFLTLYVLTHVVNIAILFVEMTIMIILKTTWVTIHESTFVNLISISIKAISFLVAALILFPEFKRKLIG